MMSAAEEHRYIRMIEDCSLVKVYELLVKNASSGFAIHLLSLEWH
jgi:hypothetical protein